MLQYVIISCKFINYKWTFHQTFYIDTPYRERKFMKYSTRLSDTLHILVFISSVEDKTLLTSTKIAESVKTNPAYFRQLMAGLKKAGIITSSRGQAQPSLTRNPELITMLDVYRAVEGNKHLLHLDIDTNPECGLAVNVQFAIADYYQTIQQTAEQKMAQITLQDIICRYHQKLHDKNE